MKQRISFIITLLFAVLFAAAFIGCADKSKEIDIKAAMSQKTVRTEPPANLDFYDQCLAKATTQEQRDMLEALRKDRTFGSVGYQKREAMLIIGELPKDQKRLSLEDVEHFLDKKEAAGNQDIDAMKECNSIAGAPDWEGGSGMYQIFYYLNDEHTDMITVVPRTLVNYFKISPDGKYQQLPIGDRTLPPPATTVGKESNTPTPNPTIS